VTTIGEYPFGFHEKVELCLHFRQQIIEHEDIELWSSVYYLLYVAEIAEVTVD
jgi:hypothetical protein